MTPAFFTHALQDFDRGEVAPSAREVPQRRSFAPSFHQVSPGAPLRPEDQRAQDEKDLQFRGEIVKTPSGLRSPVVWKSGRPSLAAA